MLTEKRREYLKTRSSHEKNAECDYRILKWLETILDDSEKGGIGDVNRVLDTFDRKAVRKHLKDKNVDDLLRLVEKLIEILDFMPIKNDPETGAYVSKSIMAAPKDGGTATVVGIARTATAVDVSRRNMLIDHREKIKRFIEAGIYTPEYRSAEYFKELIDEAHKQGLIVPPYDFSQASKEEPLK
jgi:hypothetical protein